MMTAMGGGVDEPAPNQGLPPFQEQAIISPPAGSSPMALGAAGQKLAGEVDELPTPHASIPGEPRGPNAVRPGKGFRLSATAPAHRRPWLPPRTSSSPPAPAWP